MLPKAKLSVVLAEVSTVMQDVNVSSMNQSALPRQLLPPKLLVVDEIMFADWTLLLVWGQFVG